MKVIANAEQREILIFLSNWGMHTFSSKKVPCPEIDYRQAIHNFTKLSHKREYKFASKKLNILHKLTNITFDLPVRACMRSF